MWAAGPATRRRLRWSSRGLDGQAIDCLAIARHERVEKDEFANAIGDVCQGRRHDRASVRVTDQNDVTEVLEQHEINDVINVGREIDLRANQVNSLADPRQARREDFVTVDSQEPSNLPPAMSATPTPVNKDERSHINKSCSIRPQLSQK